MVSFIVFILSLWIFVKTLTYGIYEIKQNSNTTGGIITFVFAALSLIFPNIVIFISGSYQ